MAVFNTHPRHNSGSTSSDGCAILTIRIRRRHGDAADLEATFSVVVAVVVATLSWLLLR